jgi:hypothetical protein
MKAGRDLEDAERFAEKTLTTEGEKKPQAQRAEEGEERARDLRERDEARWRSGYSHTWRWGRTQSVRASHHRLELRFTWTSA